MTCNRLALALAALLASASFSFGAAPARQTLLPVLGTWTGESLCVGNDPRCKNEVVVYRFEAIDGREDVVKLYADKILEGKRVPMYRMDFTYDRTAGTLESEFRTKRAHGVWRYKVDGDVMVGTLDDLPERARVRDVRLRRTTDAEVPPAPPREEYG